MDSGKQMLHEKPNIKGDRVNIMLLLLMYTLQSVISGFVQAFPIIFQNRKVSYPEQAEFSLTGYPSCFKLLWAPIIDCVFSKRIGRRKTWIMPMQYLMGLTLFYMSSNLDEWLGSEDGSTKPRIRLLGMLLFFCQFFSAIQDVALDGWALTMLQKRNVGHAGLCQSTGSAIGTFVAYVGFLILDSKDFANLFRTVPKDRGFVTLSEFIFFWAMTFVISTTLIFIFKKDNSLEVIEDEDCECKLGLIESYKHLWNISKRPPVLMLCCILLTLNMGFAPSISVSPLKIIDAGISRDSFVLLTMPALPLEIIFSVVMRRYITGPRPMHSVLTNYLILLLTSALLALVVFLAPFAKDQHQSLPSWYYFVLFFLYNCRSIFRHFMLLSICTFFCRVSDPRYGGIYLTLMYTMLNIGMYWPQTLSLWCVEPFTIRTCNEDEAGVKYCSTKLDGYFLETAIFAVVGFLWSLWARKRMYKLQRLEPSAWVAERNE